MAEANGSSKGVANCIWHQISPGTGIWWYFSLTSTIENVTCLMNTSFTMNFTSCDPGVFGSDCNIVPKSLSSRLYNDPLDFSLTYREIVKASESRLYEGLYFVFDLTAEDVGGIMMLSG